HAHLSPFTLCSLVACFFLGFVPVVVASLREVAIVLFRGDCSQHIPSRGTAHASRAQLCLVLGGGRCVFIWCEFLAVRATPYNASCGLLGDFSPKPRIHGPKRVGPNGRDLKLQSNPDRR